MMGGTRKCPALSCDTATPSSDTLTNSDPKNSYKGEHSMKLLIANDGMYGINNGKNITWFHNFNKACEHGEYEDCGWSKEEFMVGLTDCITNKHNVALFGINGTLLYTEKSTSDTKK